MIITKQQLVRRIRAYLNHKIGMDELVDWAENSLMDGEFPESEATALAGALARIGLIDVREFGLNWEDFEGVLREIGYKAKVELIPA